MSVLSGLFSLFGPGEQPVPSAEQEGQLLSPLASPRRTSTHAPFRSRCSERGVDPADETYPVKLVAFDMDETLTLLSYMIEEGDTEEVIKEVTKVCFETPWVQGSRIEKLQKMLEDLQLGSQGQKITLAVLTRNSAGAKAVLKLLQAADLAKYFSIVWTLPWRPKMENGAYRDGTEWVMFDPPINKVADHKADVLEEVAKHPSQWFPQLLGSNSHELDHLTSLKLEGIVLVDDQRANFQSSSGAQVKRYCKVARYDANYRNLGFCKNMGGLGAHSDHDYSNLKTFVANPSMCKETLQLHCVERWHENQRLKVPVNLVVFDLDETLTLATFMPQEPEFAEKLDWNPASLSEGDWNEEDLLEYNFETPFVKGGSRLDKLRRMLAEIARGEGEAGQQRRALAVLSRNPEGVVGVVNLLKMARLDNFFSAVWTLPYSVYRPSGAYQVNGEWRCFEAPVASVPDYKVHVLHHIVENPSKWFPQLQAEEVLAPFDALQDMRVENVVVIDDERAAFSMDEPHPAQALRYCKVARYDADYRSCGHLNQLGGIGAHSDKDYETLRAFVERPWQFLQDPPPEVAESIDDPGLDRTVSARLRRALESEETDKLPRTRRRKAVSEPDLERSPRESVKPRTNSFCVSPRTSPRDEPGGLGLCDDFDLVELESSSPTQAAC